MSHPYYLPRRRAGAGKQLSTGWGLVTVYKSNSRLKAVKKIKRTWTLGQEKSVTRDYLGPSRQWDDGRPRLTLITINLDLLGRIPR